METIIVQITNQKVYKLLQDLEELQLIKLVKLSRESKQRLSEKYASKKLPADLVHELQNHINPAGNGTYAVFNRFECDY